MKLILSLLTISVLGLVSAQESEVELYENLKSIAIFDPYVSNESINELIRRGIVSKDPVIFRLTLQTIDAYVGRQIEESPGPARSLPYRTVNEIPELKDQLIKNWRSAHGKYGYNIIEHIQRALEELPPESDGAKRTPAERVQTHLSETSAWVTIPRSLCVLWPQDDGVHTLIWEIHEKDPTVGPINLLRLLNLGKFVTPSANRYRMTQLVAYPIESGSSADEAITLAAEGLALSHPEEAIPNLLRAGVDHIDPRPEVLATLAGYDDSQLHPYHGKLRTLLSAYPLSPHLDERYLDALNRPRLYVDKPFYERWASSLKALFD